MNIFYTLRSYLPWFIGLCLLSSSCGTKVPYYGKAYQGWDKAPLPADSLLNHTIYLVGNTDDRDGQSPGKVLSLLVANARQRPEVSSSLLFSGDVAGNFEAVAAQLNGRYNGKVYVVPGDRDWKGGPDALKALEKKIEQLAGGENVFLPDNACPGPREVMINDQLAVIFVDSQWWLQKHGRPEGSGSGCKVPDAFAFLVRLEEMLERNKDKHILLVQHHPILSNGRHGGFFSFKDHIFPLTSLRKNLYVPLPVAGSLYPVFRNLGVSRQDLVHPEYQALKEKILSMTNHLDHLVIAAAHDQSLQYHKKDRLHHIISGSASKAGYARKQNKAGFVYQHQGLVQLRYYQDGSCWLVVLVPSEGNEAGKIVFKTPLYALNPSGTDRGDPAYFSDSTNVLAAGPEYEAGPFKKWWLGDHYRREWTTPVRVPLLDLSRESGGLEPVKKGGGQQTISLEVKDTSGLHYDLRSVNKNPAGAVPSPLHFTFAQDLVQDQISTAHPYGALAIPGLADAAGLFYTRPQLFQVPYTPLLGAFMNDFSGMMVLKEIELDEDLSDFERFGHAENVVSENTLYEHLTEDNDNEFDEPMFIKARLFDMLIGDWDRHDGQWGFAEFEKEEKGSVFKPIAKDRDQAFARFDGVLPYLASRKWAMRKFTHFDKDFDDVIGLNFNGRHIDRRLLTSLEWQDWEEKVDEILEQLTPTAIDEAIKDLPPEVYPLSGPSIAATLKARKQGLKSAARKYYLVLATAVNIVASDKHEYFLIERLEDGKTRVRYYKTKKDGEVKDRLYDRTFLEEETREIRIYARDGRDSIVVKGEHKSKTLIRIIAGDDKDAVLDKSTGKNVIVYVRDPEEDTMALADRTRLKHSKDGYYTKYEREAFAYNYAGPRLSLEINNDDGLYLGGGAKIITHGFKKEPAKATHDILARYAFATQAYNASYEGHFYDLFGRYADLEFTAETFGPKYIFNYFGFGNNSPERDQDIDFYRIKMDHVNLGAAISYRISDRVTLGAGPLFSYYYIRGDEESILNTPLFDQPEEVENAAYFAGGALQFSIADQDHPVNPSKGMHWVNTVQYNKELNNRENDFWHLSTDLALYYTYDLPFRLTTAVRVGAATNLGDFKFYQSNFLGGKSNLRGYRRTRFAGESMAYANAELRLGISPVSNYLFTGSWGLTGFVDTGRVWPGLDQGKWHTGYGPGLYLSVFDVLLVSTHYGFSREGGYFQLQVGHFF